MEVLKIELRLSGKDYLDLSFEDGKHSFITYAPAKKYFKSLIVLVLLMAVMSYATYFDAFLSWTLVFLFLVIIAVVIVLLKQYSSYASWKVAIKNYAKELDSNPLGSIELHENYMHYTHGTIYIEKWSDISQIFVHAKYIQFRGKDNQLYLILKKSMTSKQYDQLTEWMKQKMV